MAGHIGFQITSVLCLTITFVTGYFAVGEQNWGKNPHHAIGAAVYVGMIFQLFFGAFVRWRTHKKIRKYVPLHKMVSWSIPGSLGPSLTKPCRFINGSDVVSSFLASPKFRLDYTSTAPRWRFSSSTLL